MTGAGIQFFLTYQSLGYPPLIWGTACNCFDTVTSNVNFFALQLHHRFYLGGSIYCPYFFSTIIPILFIMLCGMFGFKECLHAGKYECLCRIFLYLVRMTQAHQQLCSAKCVGVMHTAASVWWTHLHKLQLKQTHTENCKFKHIKRYI